MELEFSIIQDLLGFNISKSDNNNYKVTDKEGNEIGFIKYKKNKNKYNTHINTNELSIKTCEENTILPNTKSSLEIYFKKFYTNITIYTGEEFIKLRMHLSNNKILMLYIDKNQFSILCQEPYDYYLTQQVIIDLIDESYTYDISFIDINDAKHDYPLYDGKINAKQIKKNPELLIIKNSWPTWRGKETKNHKSNYISTVKGNIEEAIVKHKLGIDAFNRMRYLMNTIQFKEDIINILLKISQFNMPKYLDLFIPELKSQNNIKKLIK